MNKKTIILAIVIVTSLNTLCQKPIYKNYEIGYSYYFDTTGIIGIKNTYEGKFELNKKSKFSREYKLPKLQSDILERLYAKNQVFNLYTFVTFRQAYSSMKTRFNDFLFSDYKEGLYDIYLLGSYPVRPEFETYVIGLYEKKTQRKVLLLMSIKEYEISSLIEVSGYRALTRYPSILKTEYDSSKREFNVQYYGCNIGSIYLSPDLREQHRTIILESKYKFQYDENGKIETDNPPKRI